MIPQKSRIRILKAVRVLSAAPVSAASNLHGVTQEMMKSKIHNNRRQPDRYNREDYECVTPDA
jgi:hypothetical protein